MTPEETERVAKILFVKGHAMNARFVGREARIIASAANVKVPDGTKVLIGRQSGVGEGHPLSYEKLTTVLGFYSVEDWQEACELSIKLINNGGIGHSFSMHTENPEIVMKFAAKPVFRILVNTGSTQGGVGVTTAISPAFTLGCGTWGGSATSDNVTPEHLINIKRVAYGIKEIDSIVAVPEKGSETTQDDMQQLLTGLMDLLKQNGDL